MKCFTVDEFASVKPGIKVSSLQIPVDVPVGSSLTIEAASIERSGSLVRLIPDKPSQAIPAAIVLLPAHLDARLCAPECNQGNILAIRDVNFDGWLVYVAPGDQVNLALSDRVEGGKPQWEGTDHFVLSWSGSELKVEPGDSVETIWANSTIIA